MRNPLRTLIPCSVLLALCASAAPAEAQIWKKVKDRAKQATEREVLREVDRKVTATVRCTLGDQSCIDKAKSEGKEIEVVDASGNAVAPESTPTASAKPGEGVWTNYDFVPGDRVLFFDDFEDDRVGNFPSGMKFRGGNVEVVSWQGDQMLRADGAANFAIPLPETLPERFTIEFDVFRPDAGGTTCGNGVFILFIEVDPDDYLSYADNKPGSTVAVADCKSGIQNYREGPESTVSTGRDAVVTQAVTPVRVAVDGEYIKMYLNERRIANLPNGDIDRGNMLYVRVDDYGGRVNYIDDLRIAAGGREILYDRLVADGRVALGGIFFDSGSARLRPESTPTLADIRTTLQGNPDLRLRIEGHTDNTGAADTNQRLSQQRAEAVVAYLTGKGIDASRLEAAGMGQSKPVADNGTPAGRQTNRRVELVKL